MDRRVLLAILLAVTVTALPAGHPARLHGDGAIVESLTRGEDLAGRVRQIAAILDDEVASGGNEVDLRGVQLAVPTGGHLLVTLPDAANNLTLGPTLRGGHDQRGGADRPARHRPAVHRRRGGRGKMRTTQTQVALLVGRWSWGGRRSASGFLVASVTARRLAPARCATSPTAPSRLGAGDFRLDRTRYFVPELDSVAEALDASATALAQLVQRERELVGDVSHQLRHRLTSLQLRIEELTPWCATRGDRAPRPAPRWSRPSGSPTSSTS